MKSLLFILVSLIAITAGLSGLLMISRPDGSILNLPIDLLASTPFRSYLIPGILLTTVVGGLNLLAVFFNMQRHPGRYNWAIAGGLAVSLWILLQFIFIGAAHWLHFVCLGTGVLVIFIAYQLKGKWAV